MLPVTSNVKLNVISEKERNETCDLLVIDGIKNATAEHQFLT